MLDVDVVDVAVDVAAVVAVIDWLSVTYRKSLE
jgi:hypothetical protein